MEKILREEHSKQREQLFNIFKTWVLQTHSNNRKEVVFV